VRLEVADQPMWRDAILVAGKDLRIELRSRVATNQIAPLGVLILVLFAFALGPDRPALQKASAGLFWVAILFSSVLAVQRAYAIESGDAAREYLRISGLDPAGIFVGKAAAIAIQLLGIEAVLGAGIAILYGAKGGAWLIVVVTSLLATVGLASVGTIYGVIAGGLRVKETLLPLLMLPVAAPVLLCGVEAWNATLGVHLNNALPWVRLLILFVIVYVALGIVAYGPLLEGT